MYIYASGHGCGYFRARTLNFRAYLILKGFDPEKFSPGVSVTQKRIKRLNRESLPSCLLRKETLNQILSRPKSSLMNVADYF